LHYTCNYTKLDIFRCASRTKDRCKQNSFCIGVVWQTQSKPHLVQTKNIKLDDLRIYCIKGATRGSYGDWSPSFNQVTVKKKKF